MPAAAVSQSLTRTAAKPDTEEELRNKHDLDEEVHLLKCVLIEVPKGRCVVDTPAHGPKERLVQEGFNGSDRRDVGGEGVWCVGVYHVFDAWRDGYVLH